MLTYPPIAKRVERLKALSSAQEGLVPDWLENLVKGFLVWVVVPLIGAVVLGVTRMASDLPGMWGVPWVYPAAVVWIWSVHVLLGSGATPIDPKLAKSPLLWMIGFPMLLGMWGAGLGMIYLSGQMAALSTIAPFVFWVLLAKPVVAMVGLWSGLIGVANDLITHASLVYAIVVLGLLFAQLFV